MKDWFFFTPGVSSWSVGCVVSGLWWGDHSQRHDGATLLTWLQWGDRRKIKIERQSYSFQRHSPSDTVFPTRLYLLKTDSVTSLTWTIHVRVKNIFKEETKLEGIIVWILNISPGSLRHWRLCTPSLCTIGRWLDHEDIIIINGLRCWWILINNKIVLNSFVFYITKNKSILQFNATL